MVSQMSRLKCTFHLPISMTCESECYITHQSSNQSVFLCGDVLVSQCLLFRFTHAMHSNSHRSTTHTRILGAVHAVILTVSTPRSIVYCHVALQGVAEGAAANCAAEMSTPAEPHGVNRTVSWYGAHLVVAFLLASHTRQTRSCFIHSYSSNRQHHVTSSRTTTVI